MTSDPSTSAPPAPGGFVTTHWTRVMEARGNSPEARIALSELCGAYYTPVFAFIHRTGHDEEAARDLTQEFFARLIARQGLDTVEPGRGRFRSFLLGAVKHFLAGMRDHDRAAKRGGGHAPESLDTATDTSAGLQVPDTTSPAPDAQFDRQWALTLMDRALAAAARDFKAAGKLDQFAVLKPWLVGEADALSQAEAARRLGTNEGAVKVAIHRLRKRFRELVKAEIAQTVDGAARVDEELRYLVEVLSG